jgi:hypothetical protein
MPNKSINLSLYYSNQCGHCIRFKPEWNKIKKYIDGGKNKNVSYNEYEEHEIKNKKITGFPTLLFNIKIKNKNHEIEYNGERTSEKLINIIKKIDEL